MHFVSLKSTWPESERPSSAANLEYHFILSSPFCVLIYFDWNVPISHLPRIHSEIKRSCTVDTYHKSLIRSTILLNSISCKYILPSTTLINYIFYKFIFRGTTLTNYVSRKFLSTSTPVQNYTFHKSIPSDRTLQVATKFQKKSTTNYISRKSLFKNKKLSTSSRVNPYSEAKQRRTPNRIS
jgi:hypothetical protein